MSTNSELELAIENLVEKILQRGRLNQLEKQGELNVKDGGVVFAKQSFIKQIKQLATTEAVALADSIIGKDLSKESSSDAIQLQQSQRVALAHYQTPVVVTQSKVIEIRDSDFRVDRNKPTMELVGVTGREQNSINEE